MENIEQGTITIGSDVGKKVICSMCCKEGTTEEFVTMRDNKGEDIYLCEACKEKTNETFEKETKNPNILLGIALGVVGAALGGAIWYLVAVYTGMEIGYISLGLGYLVGIGVYFGSGKKRGVQLQLISAVIALIAILVTQKYIFGYFLNDYVQNNLSEFPGVLPGEKISVSITDPEFLRSLASPIGLLIYAIGIYVAFRYCQPRKI